MLNYLGLNPRWHQHMGRGQPQIPKYLSSPSPKICQTSVFVCLVSRKSKASDLRWSLQYHGLNIKSLSFNLKSIVDLNRVKLDHFFSSSWFIAGFIRCGTRSVRTFCFCSCEQKTYTFTCLNISEINNNNNNKKKY